MPRMTHAALLAAAGLAVSAQLAWATPAYRIVSQDIVRQNTISQDKAADSVRVSVRLDARVAASDLQRIADDVRARLPANQIVGSVAFYLPQSQLNGNAWADVKFAPLAGVTVYGLRLDEEDAHRAEASADTRNRIGVWLTSPPALAGRLTLYRNAKGKTFAEWQLRNGQKTTDEVFESRAQGGRRFDIAGGDGGYYRLDGNGALELGNARSVIAIAEPLKLTAPKAGVVTPAASVAPGPAPAAQTTPLAAAHPGPAQTVGLPAAGLAPVVSAATPARKRTVTVRPHAPQRAVRQADNVGDAITRALTQ